MIKPKERFMSEGQAYFGPPENPRSPAYCNVWDWDQLRMIKVVGTAKLFLPDEDVEVPLLAQFADYLSPEVRAVTVNDEGLIIDVSTDPEQDDTIFLAYLPLSITTSLHNCPVIQHSKLRELDRLGPGVDLSVYEDEFGITQKVAFKFNPIAKPRRLQMEWDQLNIVKNLPPHPNIVPFDRLVLEDVESRVIGFTTKYIPGGTLDENQRLPFRFEWLQQLTQLIDYLNLDLGIMHQDIAPRNLLIDPDTQKLLLFDFDWAAHGEKNIMKGRDDVDGLIYTLYEIITGDASITEIPHWDRNVETVQNLSEWTLNRELDADVSTFRDFLNEWVAKRRSDGDMQRYLNAPNRLTWPDRPIPPDYNVPFPHGILPDGTRSQATGFRSRRTAMNLGQYVFRWERPPQCRLKKSEGLST